MGLRFRVGPRSSGFVFEGLSFRKTWTRIVTTTSVRFTGVLAQDKMNVSFIFHRNLIDCVVDLKGTIRDRSSFFSRI